jgi:hypothetical protein
MLKQLLLAAVLGGIAMFLWEGFSHEVLPLGQAGLRGLDNETAVVGTLRENVKQAGFYIFPGGEMLQSGLSGDQKKAVIQRASELWRKGPSGIMIVHPEGLEMENPRNLLTQCLLDILVTLIAAFLLSKAAPGASYGQRVLFVTLIGLVPTLNAELPYWNWYGFPTNYILAVGLVHLIGFGVAGLVVARFVKPPSAVGVA